MRDGKSLINYSVAECLKEGKYDQGNWYYASRGALEYYMDPRNALTEKWIFQFENLNYNEAYHTEEALVKILDNTFMGKGALVPGTAMTFPFLIWACGKNEEVLASPFHLAARIKQEQGAGQSALISGSYPGFEGYYNYFNIGATGKTNKEIIENGLAYARKTWGKSQNGNDNLGAYLAIFVGSKIIAENYIHNGQDTLYLQKYNVLTGTYTHQYMQNISAPTTESKTIHDMYESAGVLDAAFVFRIPVYQNMPAQACQLPTSSTNVVLEIDYKKDDPYRYTGKTVMIDGEAYTAETYEYISAKKKP